MTIRQSRKKKLNLKFTTSITIILALLAIASINSKSANADVIVIPSNLGGSASVTFNTVGLGSEFDGQLISQFYINWHTGGEGNITVPGGTLDDVNAASMFEGTLLSPLASSLPNTQYVIHSMTGSAQETSPVIWPRPGGTDFSWALYVKSNTENVIVTITYIPQYKVTFDASPNVKTDSTDTILTVNGTALTVKDLPYTTDWVSEGDKLEWAYSNHVASTSDPTNLVYSWGSTSGLDQTGQSGTLTVNSPGTITGNYIQQVHNTFRATGLSGTDYVTLTGTFSGFSGSQLCNLSAINNWQADVYCDYNTPITFSGSSHNSGSTERWAFQNALPYTTAALTTSGGIYSQTYYHQYAFSLDYAVIGGGGTDPSLDAPILSGTSAGEVGYINNILPLHGDTVISLWLDAGSTWQLSSQLRRSTDTERWATNQPTTGTVNAPVTTTYTYYRQVKNTITAQNVAGTCSIVIPGTLFGNSGTLVTLNSGNSWSTPVWSDYDTTITFPATSTPVNGERWQFFSAPNTFSFSSSGNSFIASDGVHQYQVTFNYNIAAIGSLDNDPIAHYTKFGVACNATALTYSGPTDWVDAGTSVLYQNNIFSIGYYPLWQINLPVTDGKSVIPEVINRTLTLSPTYFKRAELRISIDGITGQASTNIYGTSFGVPNTLIMTLNESNGWNARAWVDDGTDATLPATLFVNENERWLNIFEQDYTFTVNVAYGIEMGSNFYTHQYRNQYNVTGLSGTDSLNIIGTYLGSNTTIATLYASNGWSAYAWTDQATIATFSTSALSNANERWITLDPLTVNIVSGGNTYTKSYQHQYNITFQYALNGNSTDTISSPTVHYTKFGNETVATATSNTSTFDWVDAGTVVSYTNPLTGANSTSRWQTQISTATFTINRNQTLNPTYYKQYLVAVHLDGLSGAVAANVYGTAFGSVNSVNLTLNSGNNWRATGWFDFNSSFTVPCTLMVTENEQWILGSGNGIEENVTDSIDLSINGFYHLWRNQYVVTGLQGSDTIVVTGKYMNTTWTIATLSSANDWSAYGWIDDRAVATFPAVSSASNNMERWIIDNTYSTSPITSGNATYMQAYIHQCKIIFTISGDDLIQKSGVILTINGNNFTCTQLPYTSDWINASETLRYTYQSIVANSSNSRYFWDTTTGLGQTCQKGILTVTSPGTITAAYGIEYAVTTEANGKGTINPSNAYYHKGANQTFTITPQTGYHIVDVTVDSKSVGPVSSLPISDIQSGHKITVTFAEDPHPTPTVSPTESPTHSNNTIWSADLTLLLSIAALSALLLSLFLIRNKRPKI